MWSCWPFLCSVGVGVGGLQWDRGVSRPHPPGPRLCWPCLLFAPHPFWTVCFGKPWSSRGGGRRASWFGTGDKEKAKAPEGSGSQSWRVIGLSSSAASPQPRQQAGPPGRAVPCAQASPQRHSLPVLSGPPAWVRVRPLVFPMLFLTLHSYPHPHSYISTLYPAWLWLSYETKSICKRCRFSLGTNKYMNKKTVNKNQKAGMYAGTSQALEVSGRAAAHPPASELPPARACV